MIRRRWSAALLAVFLLLTTTPRARSAEGVWSINDAVVVARADVPATVLIEEVAKRTGVVLPRVSLPLDKPGPMIVLSDDGRGPAEGYTIRTKADARLVAVQGNDARGLLFGVGRLLREMSLSPWTFENGFHPGLVAVPTDLTINSAPAVKLRGHQLGYRPKTNSYDAWDLPQWDQYIRDLAVFGTNAIELVPPRTDDDLHSPHFPRPPLEMMTGMSRICDKYGLDVWIWFPVMDPVDEHPEKTEPLLKEWETVLKALPRVDAVFVPGGDPGHIPPKPLFAYLAKAYEVLHKIHPKATMWVSPQGFSAATTEEFLSLVREEPAWLTGLVFGPQVRVPLEELRKVIPAKMPIRGYPDITHSRQCQHPVPDWDLAYACTEGRESINPRPLAQADLVRAYRKGSIGFISYSEGCNDDVNKFVWSGLAWSPDEDVKTIVEQYARYLIGGHRHPEIAEGLFALERNWSGPLAKNTGVEKTLALFESLEATALPETRKNWRFQQAVYRANYDVYLKERLLFENQQQASAMARLDNIIGDENEAIVDALKDLDAPFPANNAHRTRVFELGEALFQSIGMQLSKPKYQAIDPERGANLDTIDTPLNDRVWLRAQLGAVLGLPDREARLAAIKALVNRTDPGPGGFYDALGDPDRSPHLVREPSYADDPMFVRAPFHGFALRPDWPVAWRRYAHTFYDAPLLMRYKGLDPKVNYRLRVVYSGDSPKGRIQCEANGKTVHPLIVKPNPVAPIEFDIPDGAVTDGTLTLKWNQEPGRGGNGRGCQVAEVWLMKGTK